uniref:L-gulonolactone oxidase n=1 Tax=Ciona savignyi TaxID=51511 RepID=H2ZBD3_CIOSA
QVKVVGAGLSPSDIACTTDYMISLKNFNKVLDVDSKKHTITVEAGVTIEELNNSILPANGLSFSNLGSVSGQSIGGIIGTGSHGTGGNFGSFASCVLQLVLMKADGTILQCSKEENEELFSAACCHLGLLGIILNVKLQCEPAFNLHEIKRQSKLESVLVNLNDYISSSQHFLFHWFPHTDNVVTVQRNRTKVIAVPQKESWFKDMFIGYHMIQFCLWIATFIPSITPFLTSIFFKICYSGFSESIERSDKVFNINCLFKQYVTEWAVPKQNAVLVLRKMYKWLSDHPSVKVHFPVEVRFVQKDNIMMSPSCDQDVVYIGIISYRPYGKFVPHAEWFTFFEDLMLRFGGRPHWAKDHKVKSAQFQKLYSNYHKFLSIRQQLDPDNLFLNAYWKRILD